MSALYSKELLKVAVAKACVSQGITHTSEAVLESLADVLRHYIETMSSQMQDLCEAGGRVVPGVQDLLPTLVPDWRGLSSFAFEDLKNPTTSKRYSEPFPFTVTPFPVPPSDTTHKPSVLIGEQTRGAHIPPHLPMYPPMHTYKIVESKSKKRKIEVDSVAETKRKAAESKRIQSSLSKLEQQQPKDESEISH